VTAHKFPVGHGSITAETFQWAKENPVLNILVAKTKPTTARKYLGALRTYWADVLSKNFATFADWVESVKKAQREPDFEDRIAWAREVEKWILSHPEWTAQTRRGYVVGIQAFLEHKIGKESARNYPFSYETPEEKENGESSESDTTTVDYDEIRQLVHTAKSKRDKALVLTILSGLGASEFLDFNRKWFSIYEVLKSRTPQKRWKDEIEPVRIPKGDLKAHLVRKKRGVQFYTFLVDDQIDALADLVEERESQMGRPLTKEDALFVTNWRVHKPDCPVLTSKSSQRYEKCECPFDPMSDARAQEQIRYLRAESGVKNPERLRIHEMGRDTLQTLLGNLELKPREKNYGDFVLGHTVDPLKYDKSPWTADGENAIRELFTRLRPTLNLITKRGESKTEIIKELVDTKARKQNEFLLRLFWDKMTDEEKRNFIEMSPFAESLKKRLSNKDKEFLRKQLPDKTADSESPSDNGDGGEN
jgi:hypothetical protein